MKMQTQNLSIFLLSICILACSLAVIYCDTVYLNDLPSGNEFLVKSKTRVNLPNVNHTLSYSGYVAMDSGYQSALFYWMFPAQNNNSNAPVIVYMEGGPGFASEIQVFNGIGPLFIDQHGIVHENNNTWTREYTVIYIDNPVGVGFSYCHDPKLYSRNQQEVSQNLYNGLSMILQKYESLRTSPVYIWGESYGGKYVPSLTYKIAIENEKSGSFKINLAGMGIGNPLSDPISQITSFADFASQSGLIDMKERLFIEKMQDEGVDMIKRNKWFDASIQYFLVAYNVSQFAGNVSIHDITNYRLSIPYSVDFIQYLSRSSIGGALHVGSNPYSYVSQEAIVALLEDVSKSCLSLYTEILQRNIRVMVYNGVYDMLCNAPGVERMLYSISFPEVIQPFINAKKTVWQVDNKIAGFVKQYQNMNFVWIVESGHFVMNEQPIRALHLVHNFIQNRPFAVPQKKSSNI